MTRSYNSFTNIQLRLFYFQIFFQHKPIRSSLPKALQGLLILGSQNQQKLLIMQKQENIQIYRSRQTLNFEIQKHSYEILNCFLQMSKKSFVPIDYSSSSSPSQYQDSFMPHIPKLSQQRSVNREPDHTASELIAIILKDLNDVRLPIPQPFKRTQSFKLPQETQSGCTCKKTKCLKMYCQCFASGGHCKPGCSCFDCSNNQQGQQERVKSILSILERDPCAFNSRQSKQNSMNLKGCNCRKSGCLKKYCDCYTSGVGCTSSCGCQDCQNFFTQKPKLKLKKFMSIQDQSQSKVLM